MRESFTPEEVTRIEDKAYEVGMNIGKLNERERILAIWDAEMQCPCETPMHHLASLIKGENNAE
jgi:hypothetical protein